jgi:hypothetical protein
MYPGYGAMVIELAPAAKLTVPKGFNPPPSIAPLDIVIWYMVGDARARKAAEVKPSTSTMRTILVFISPRFVVKFSRIHL